MCIYGVGQNLMRLPLPVVKIQAAIAFANGGHET